MMLTSTPEQQPQQVNAATESTAEDFDFDPTYGMAAYAHHKSIGNVRPDDAAGSHLRFDNSTNDNIENSGWPSAPKRKRVHFNIVETVRDTGDMRSALTAKHTDNISRPYDFTAAKLSVKDNAPSLRSRIAGFFASLF